MNMEGMYLTRAEHEYELLIAVIVVEHAGERVLHRSSGGQVPQHPLPHSLCLRHLHESAIEHKRTRVCEIVGSLRE